MNLDPRRPLLAVALAVALIPATFIPLTASVQIRPVAHTYLAAVIGFLSVSAAAISTASRRRFPFFSLLCFFVYSVAILHLAREAFQLFVSGWIFRVVAAALALLLFSASASIARAMRPSPILRTGLLSAVAATVLLLPGYGLSPYLRWVMLQQANALGAPLQFLLGEAVSVNQPAGVRPREETALARIPDRAATRSDQPDLYFLLIDALRADAVPPWAQDDSQLPVFRRLAKESLVYFDVHSNSGWTRSSLASFFTGLLPEEHGARNRPDALGTAQVTLAERLSALGYATAALVSNYSTVGRDAGFDQGFDVFEEIVAEPYARADVMFERARGVIASRDRDRPIFLFIHLLDPHGPYLSGQAKRAWRRFDSTRSGYAAEVEYVDQHLGPFLETLNLSTHRDFYLLTTSDHGEEFGEHGWGGHGHSLYRELVHIPAYLFGTQVRPGISHAPLEARDFFGLFTNLGAGTPDLSEWLNRSSRGARYSSLYLTVSNSVVRRFRNVALRRLDDGADTIIWNAYGNTIELYDNTEDPCERNNTVGIAPGSTDELYRRIAEHLPEWTEAVPATMSEQTLEQLRSLGYIN